MSSKIWKAKSINQLIEQFENGSLPKEEWTHHAHLIVCAHYLHHFDLYEATLHIKLGIIRFNEAISIPNTMDGGYHETLTQFWIWAVNAFKSEFNGQLDEMINRLLSSPHSKKYLPFFFYSEDLLFSPKSRVTWVGPDINPMDASLIISDFPSSIWYGDDLF